MVSIAALSRPLQGEVANGDGFFIATTDQNNDLKKVVISTPGVAEPAGTMGQVDLGDRECALLAVVDGVGHGPQAAEATSKILAALEQHWRLDLALLVQECHRAATGSRGATLGLARISMPDTQVRVVGIGDVRLQLVVSQRDEALSRGSAPEGHGPSETEWKVHRTTNNNGTVGYTMPSRLQKTAYGFRPGDLLVMSTDGVNPIPDTASTQYTEGPESDEIAKSLLSSFGRVQDDATVIVVR